MGSATTRPKLRSVESVIVPDENHGRAVMLRDTEGIAPNALLVPVAFLSVLQRFDGSKSLEEIAAKSSSTFSLATITGRWPASSIAR